MTTELSIWVDEDRETSVKVAAAALVDTARHEGHSSISEPLRYQFPSGLVLTINCEKVPTEVYHIGIEYDGELQMMLGFNSNLFSMRVFPPDHSSFIVNLGPPDSRFQG
jgi:hypothetical protein